MALVCSVVSSHCPLPPPSPLASTLLSDGVSIKAIAKGIAVEKKDTSETKMTLSLVAYGDDISGNAWVISACGWRETLGGAGASPTFFCQLL